MKKESTLSSTLIAPCGMNCGICLGFLREKTGVMVVQAIQIINQHIVKPASLKTAIL